VARIDFVSDLHRRTGRDYRERVVRGDKAECAEVAKRFGPEYWDGDRRYGYGGYRYDGRWAPVARRIADHYGLGSGSRVLDVGCGKAHLVHELTLAVPGLDAWGIDVSDHALADAPEPIRPRLVRGSATSLPFPDASFDLVLSLNVLHNLYVDDLFAALAEIGRVGRRDAYVVVESWRNEREKANLLDWQLTCECFFTPREWEWVFARAGYRGDHSFVFFE